MWSPSRFMHKPTTVAVLRILLALAALVGGCSPKRSDTVHALTQYPRERWRLAPHELRFVHLNIAHILVRHRNAQSQTAPYTALPVLRSPAPQRDRAEAQRI